MGHLPVLRNFAFFSILRTFQGSVGLDRNRTNPTPISAQDNAIDIEETERICQANTAFS